MNFESEAREIFGKWESVGELKLRVGELSAQEIRTVHAVLKAVKAETLQAIRRAFIAGQSDMREMAKSACDDIAEVTGDLVREFSGTKVKPASQETAEILSSVINSLPLLDSTPDNTETTSKEDQANG